MNTNMCLRDLEVMIKIKKEAKYTILALEKLLEEQMAEIKSIREQKKREGKSRQPAIVSTASDTNATSDDE